MPRFVISPAAERDIESILAWSIEHFGPHARLRYEDLLLRAILDVADDPNRPGSHARPELADDIRTYHLRHSRERSADAAKRGFIVLDIFSSIE